MLRITIVDTATEQRWVVQGRLTEPWVSELLSTWKKAQTVRRGKACVVNLDEVTFIDESGEDALLAMAKEGARFVAVGVYTKQVVEHVNTRRAAGTGAEPGTRRE